MTKSRDMDGKELFARWNAVHAQKYFKKYDNGFDLEDRITDYRIFEYIDTVQSNVLKTLLENYSLDHILRDFKEALENEI